MQFSKALAPLAILALSMPSPVYAAKEAKVPRCNGQSKRPANPYGTVLPTLPSRKPSEAASATSPTQLFAPAAKPQESRSDIQEQVPPISKAAPLSSPLWASRPTYASC